MEENQIKFIRDLHQKYGIELTPDKEAKALELFTRDFDGSLSGFYKKFNPGKEVTPELSNKFRETYGFASPTIKDPYAIQPIDSPKSVSTFESIKNSVSNFTESGLEDAFLSVAMWLKGTEKKVETGLKKAVARQERGSLMESVAEAALNFWTWTPDGSTNDENLIKIAERKKELSGRVQETYSFTDLADGVSAGKLAAAAVDGAAGFLPSLAVGVTTFGTGFIPMFAGSAYGDALLEKSEVTDKDIQQILASGEEDWFIPTFIGSIAGALERFGLKGVGGYLAGRFAKAGSKEAVDIAKKTILANKASLSSLTGEARKKALSEIASARQVIRASETFVGSTAKNVTRQSFINWTEHGLHEFAKEHGKSESVEKATEKMVDAMFSKEGLDAFAGAGLGTLLTGGLAKGTGSAYRKVTGQKNTSDTVATEEKSSEEQDKIDKEIESKIQAAKSAEGAEIVDKDLEAGIDGLINEFKEKEKAEAKAKEESLDAIREEEESKKAKKELAKEEKKNATAEEEIAKDVIKNVKDLKSLTEAIYGFFGVTERTKDNVDMVTKISAFVDSIATSRARREGMSKSDWYQSRLEKIGRAGEAEGTGAMANFLADGRATIMALQSPTAKDFLREFYKVVGKDLNATERAALQNEFGVVFGEEMSQEALDVFANAFESYMEEGVMPSNVKGANKGLLQEAFAKIAEWIKDLKEAVSASDIYVKPEVRRIFDAIVTATDIQQEQKTETKDVETATKKAPDTDVKSDTEIGKTSTESSETVKQPKGEVVDLTEAQEEVTDKQVEDEQKTKKADGKKPRQDAQKPSKDKPSAKGTAPKPAKPQAKQNKKQIEDADKVLANVEDFQDYKINRKTNGQYSKTSIDGAKKLLARVEKALKGDKTKSQEDLLNVRKQQLEELLAENEALQKEFKEATASREKAVQGLREAGVSKKEAERIVSEEGNIEVLSFEDGVVTFTKDGDIGEAAIRVSDGKRVEGKTAITKLKNEVKKEAKAKERDSIQSKEAKAMDAKANQAFSYMTKEGDTTSKANIKRVLDRILAINFLSIESYFPGEIAGLRDKEFKREFVSFINSVFDSRGAKGKINKSTFDSFEEFKGRITEAINKEGFLSESQKQEIAETMRSFEAEYREQQEVQAKAEANKSKDQAEQDIFDSQSPVTSIGAGKPFANFLERLVKGFKGMSDRKFILVDINKINSDEKLMSQFVNTVKEVLIKELSDENTPESKIREYLFNDKETIYSTKKENQENRAAHESLEKVLDGLKNSSIFQTELAGVDIIAIKESNNLQTYAAIAHEFGHSLETNFLNNMGESVRAEMIEDYKSWAQRVESRAESSKDSISKSVGGKAIKVITDAFSIFLSGGAVSPALAKKVMSEGGDVDIYRYTRSFREYWAEQVTSWAFESKTPRTALGKLFRDVADSLKRLFAFSNYSQEVSPSVRSFLDTHFNREVNRLDEAFKSQRNTARADAVNVAESIQEEQRKIDDLTKELEGLKNNRPTFDSSATKESIAQALAERKEAIAEVQKRIDSSNSKIDRLNKKMEGVYEEFKKMGGDTALKDFIDVANKKAEEARERRIARDVNKIVFSDPDDMISFRSGASKRNSAGRQNLIESIGKLLDGKFNNMKEFKVVAKAINDRLEANGMTKLSSKEMEMVLNSTRSGALAQIRGKLLERYVNFKRKDLKDVIESMDASEAERADAQEIIEEIITGIKKVMAVRGEKIPNSREKFLENLRRKYKDGFNDIAKLELIGINNASIKEIERVTKEGHANAVITNQVAKVRAEAQSLASENGFERDAGFLESIAGYAIEGDKFSGKIGNAKVSGRIHRMNNSYKKGEFVYHNGKYYQANQDIPANTAFKSTNFDFKYNYRTSLTKAEIDKKSFINAAKSFINNMFLSSHGIESLISKISKGDTAAAFKGRLNKMFGEEGFRLAGVRSRNDFYEMDAAMDQVVMDAFGLKDKKAAKKKLYEARTKTKEISYKDNNGNTVKKTFYMSELMDYYAALRQPDLARRFEAMTKAKLNGGDAKFWNASKEAAVLDAIPAEYKQAVEKTVDEIMPKMYNKLNATFRKINGYDLISLENYFPVTGTISGSNTTEMDLDYMDTKSFLASVSNSNLKDRGRGGSIQASDFVMKYYSYVSRASHYTHYAVPMKKASLLFGENTFYGKELSDVFGKDIVDQINWNLNNIAANGAANYHRNRYVDMIRGMGISGAFMANLTMIPKQLSSFAAYADSMPTGKWLGYYTKLATNPKKFINDIREINNMNFIKERLAQGGRSNLDTINLMLDKMTNEVNKPEGVKRGEQIIHQIKEALFLPTKFGDIGAIYMGGVAYWSHIKEEAKQKFPNDTARQREYAEVKFEETTSRTQQSRAMLDAGKWQTKGSTESMFVTFMSTPMLYGRMLSAGYRDIAKGIANNDYKLAGAGAKRVALFGFALPYLFLSASSGSLGFLFDDDDDSESAGALKTAAAYFGIASFQHVPILYPILQNQVDRNFLNKQFDLTIVPTLGIAQKAIVSGERLVNRAIDEGMIDFDDDAVMRDISNVGKAVGINLSTTMNLYEAWANFDDTVAKDWRLLMGYSPYAIGLEKPGDRSKIK